MKNQGRDARKLGERRSGGAAECQQEPGRFAQAVLSQARLQISAVRSVRARDRQLGRPLWRRAARADQLAGTCCGKAPIRSPRGRRRSTSLLTKALAQGFADVLNKVASAGYEPWAVNSPQSIFGKAFAPFRPQGRDQFHRIRPRLRSWSTVLASKTARG